MPPARKRPRAYDPARARTAVLAQFGNVRAAVRTLTPEQLALPTRLGDRTVRELVVHVGTVLDAVDRLLGEPEPARQDGRLPDWPLTVEPEADPATARPPAVAPPDLDAHLEEVERRFTAHLDARPGGRLLPTGAGALPLADYVVTRAVGLVVHTDDLAAAVPGLDIPYDRQALAAATRLLADALAVKAPGGSTEVRIPPYAVVQCVEGPRHTRGTPPNVVETDPLTWIRLATGRLTWADALAGAKVSASGERADLGSLLPLPG
ncbi:maleylpyruvate isomerase family mycothiol-dependent enzyme [Streptomyces olivaceus]|uniref:maleylpyruvate isomerase family mycothiol-dependent enzyme n=1 Tax=Streptomyces olivaceus TaxID=47716 RepID=UPI001CCAD722|nr:maleylpyruvate isomerase family mycothiol-dependent enzyme [Streptomyces olivaceus]MBZ6142546.1 maleylpyruvate isomerase family mycothiol-dependent enzyme [Streptomyces olivaceus]MBZ6170221.1 maleylpyruvate isomerase family mycothiol-dependent enzyme [Streptomyces olivaceus]